MLILYTSTDGLWYFVRTRSSCGWVPVDSVVIMDKSEWLNYIHADSFIVVCSKYLVLTAPDLESESLVLTMGTILPIDKTAVAGSLVNGQSIDGNYVVRIPVRAEEGERISYKRLLIPMTADVSLGYMEYTPSNVVEQALKLAGEKVNPGGINDGWDDISYISSIFSCFGIYFPTDRQQLSLVPGNDTDLSLASLKERQSALDDCTPGTMIFTDKSVSIYLGKEKGDYFILGPFGDFFIGEARYTANSFIITDAGILFDNGSTYLNSIKLIKTPAVMEKSE